MVLVRKAVRVGKVGVRAAELRRALVHLFDKGRDTAGYAVGEDVAGLVGAVHHRAVQEILIAHDLAGLDAGGARVGVQPLETVGLGRDHFLKRDLAALERLDREEHGHDLGQAGRGALLVGVFRIEKSAGIQIGQNDGLGAVKRGLVKRARRRRKSAEEQAERKNKRNQFVFFHFALPFFTECGIVLVLYGLCGQIATKKRRTRHEDPGRRR